MMSNGFGSDLGSAHGSITLDISQLARAAKEAQRHIQDIDKGTANFGKALDSVGRSSALIGGGIAVGVGLAIRSFASFDKQLAGVAASLGGVGTAAGITEQQFAQLHDTALRIGEDTAFSANEAAAAMDVLARAGVSANDIINGVADASVNLAAAIGEDIPQSAEAIASALAIFGLKASDAAAVTDTLTAALNSSQTDLADFSAGMRNLGPAMASVGGSFQDAAAAIAFFTKFGLKGADVGVSLSRAMDHLAKPTTDAAALMKKLGIAAFDAQGNFVGWPALMDQFNKALSGTSDEQRVFAIQTIAGAEAADVLNIAVQQGGSGLRDMTSNLTPAGQAAEQAAQRMDSLAGTLEQLRGSLEVAAIAAGGALAPAVESLSGMIAGLADGFSALPGPVRDTASQAIAAAGAFALITAAGAKIISIGINTAAAWMKMAAALRESAVAMRIFTLATGPIGAIALAIGIAAGALLLLRDRQHDAAQAARDHAEAVKALETEFDNLAKMASDLRMEGATDTANALGQLNSTLEVSIGLLNAAADAAEKGETGYGKYAQAIIEAGGSSDVLRKNADALAASLPAVQEALRHTGLDTGALARDLTTLADSLLHNQISADQYASEITDITTHLDRYQIKTKEATKATEDFTTTTKDEAQAIKDAEEAQRHFNEQVDQLVSSSLDAIKGVGDLTDEIDGMQSGFSRAGASIETVLLKMDDLGQLNLSPAEREALKLQRALDGTESAIDRTTSAIQNNADDMSMWQGRISLVDDTIGTAEDGYAGLNKLVSEGKLTQEEANKILDDAIFLRERSVGGLEDERAEQAKQISVLADYVKAHDDANESVKNLTASQEGFLAATQSSTGQTFLATLQTLAYLAALGQIPPEKVTEFIANSADADPVLAALIEDLGLIPPKKEVKVTATDDGATAAIDDVGSSLDELPPTTNVGVTVTTPEGIEIPVPDPVTIPSEISAPDTGAIDDLDIGTVTIPTVLGDPGATSGMADTGTTPEPANVTQTITTTVVVDDAAATQAIADINATLDTLDAREITIDVNLGNATGSQITDLDTSIVDTQADLTSLLSDLNSIPKTVSTGFSFSEGETAGKAEAIRDVLDDWPKTISTGFSFSEGETAGKAETVSALLEDWPETISTAFSFDQGTSAESIAGATVQIHALAVATARAGLQFDDLEGALSQAMGIAASELTRSTSEMSSNLITFAGQSSDAGARAGAGFSSGLAAGISAAAGIASQGAANVLASLQVSAAASSTGFGVGTSFGQGLAAGISSQTGSIAGAAAAAASAAYAAAAAQLQVRSPSKRGDFLGRMFDRGIAEGIAAAVPEIMRQSKSAALSASDSFETNIRDLAMRGFAGSNPLLGWKPTATGDGGVSHPSMASTIAPTGFGAGQTFNDNRVFNVLKSDELVGMIDKSERGHRAMEIFEDTPRATQNLTGRR